MLFYSTRCGHCKQVIDTLAAMNKKNLCQYIAIDGRPRNQLPSFLKSVPTLYLPETKDVVVGTDIYGYIAKPVVARREVPSQENRATPQQQVRNALPNTKGLDENKNTDYAAWSFDQVKGMTEQYTAFTEKPMYSDEQAHFSFLSAESLSMGPIEPKTEQSYSGDKHGRNGDMEGRMKALQKERDSSYQGVVRK